MVGHNTMKFEYEKIKETNNDHGKRKNDVWWHDS